MNRFVVRRLVTALVTSGILAVSSQAMAAAFQLYEQDGASLGTFHAGYAAWANDASTAFYNPAGMTRIHNQQMVFSGNAIASDFTYRGTVTVVNLPNLPRPDLRTGVFTSTQSAGTFAMVPAFHYVTPIMDQVNFGFSVTAPFGLQSSYGISQPSRYAATYSEIKLIDLSPSIGVRVWEGLSLGAGFDAQKARASFNSVTTTVTSGPASDTDVTNKAYSSAYGYHLGALYEVNPCMRIGGAYHSQTVHHFHGHSRFDGPLAANFGYVNGLSSPRTTASVTLPAYSDLSIYAKAMPELALMGTVGYTQWNSVQQLQINGVAGLAPRSTSPFVQPSTNITVTSPTHYQNSWFGAVGAEYNWTDSILLRTGLAYDQSPIRNAYRDVRLPDASRVIMAFGGHAQATKTVGFDVGYAHLFMTKTARVHPPTLVTGASTVTSNGRVKGAADVFSTQLTWDIV